MRISDWSSDVCSSDLPSRLKAALGRRHDIAEPFVTAGRDAQRAAKRLEDGLDDVVRVAATQIVDVQRHLGVVDEALEELAEQIDVELADPRTRKVDEILEVGAAGPIDDDARERLVERHIAEIGRAHVRTPVTNAPLVCRHLLEKKKTQT